MTQETIDPAVPVTFDDPLNARILAVSEDRVQGYHAEPFREISRLSGVDLPDVLERVRAMLAAGTVRRVRQTLTELTRVTAHSGHSESA